MNDERKAAIQLVSDGEPENFRTQWYRNYSSVNQAYIQEVVQEIIKNPKASLQLVARNLAVELLIKSTEVPVIVATLEDMIHNVKAAQ